MREEGNVGEGLACDGSCSDKSVEERSHLSLFTLKPIDERTKPFLRWAGGKTKLLETILPFVPSKIEQYYEPFLGSGAVFFAIRDRIAAYSYLTDLNEELINSWQVVRNHPKTFLAALEAYRGRDTEEHYYVIRALQPRGAVQRAARFYYLNQTAWNGLWRVNGSGVFNVPWGARPFRGLNSTVLFKTSRTLATSKVACLDFREALAGAGPGDFVYLDPPYLPVSDTSKFSGYTEKRFRKHDLAELADLCRGLSGKGVTWVMSNRDTPAVRELFSHARVVRFTTWRSVAAQNRRNVQPAASPEVLVIGGGRP